MFLMENWYLVVALMAVAGMVGVFIGRFLKMPTAAQREKVKEWLLWAVTQAEAELGSGTGKLKLRQTPIIILPIKTSKLFWNSKYLF